MLKLGFLQTVITLEATEIPSIELFPFLAHAVTLFCLISSSVSFPLSSLALNESPVYIVVTTGWKQGERDLSEFRVLGVSLGGRRIEPFKLR